MIASRVAEYLEALVPGEWILVSMRKWQTLI